MSAARVSAGIALALAALRIFAPAPLELLDLKALDYRHLVRGPLAAGGEVVVIGIDEPSLTEIGRWPWPRSQLARLVDRLDELGAAVIGFDIVFDQPDQTLDVAALRAAVRARPVHRSPDLLARLDRELDNDARFADAIRRSGRVVLGHFFDLAGAEASTLAADAAGIPELSVSTRGGATPATTPAIKAATRIHADLPVLLEAAAGAGHLNFLPDLDGLYRRLPIAIRVGERLAPALSVEVLRRYRGGAMATLTLAPDGVTAVRVGDGALPVDGAGQLWVNYLGPPRTIPRVGAADVLAGRVPREALAGKIALVGFTATGFDEIATPFSPVAPGIETQATVLDNVLHGRALRRPWWVIPVETAVVFVLGLGLGLLPGHVRTVGGALAAFVTTVGYAWGTQWLFTASGLAIGAVYPFAAIVFCTLGGTIYQSLAEEREKRKIRDAFRLYLNPEVADMVAGAPEMLRLGGERREITIFFSDIRDFTTISERLRPEELGELLNEYLGAMTDIVFRHDGLLDKYIGDALMAFWGAPVAAPDHAARCCRAALDMVAALGELHARWRDEGLPLIEFRIGINTGEAVVGNFGSAQRFSYTAMGDDVNLASRIEGLNKEYGTRVLVSEHTRQVVGDEFVCREIDRVRVKGREQAVAVYELLGRGTDDADGHLARRAAAFEAALAAYRGRRWEEAIARLEALAEEHPDDRAIRPFLDRCHRFRTTPPGEAWEAISGRAE